MLGGKKWLRNWYSNLLVLITEIQISREATGNSENNLDTFFYHRVYGWIGVVIMKYIPPAGYNIELKVTYDIFSDALSSGNKSLNTSFKKMLRHIDNKAMVKELCDKKLGMKDVSGKDHNEKRSFIEALRWC